MRDDHYMEDENEWPYLVWEKKDSDRRYGNSKPVPINLEFKDIPFREFPTYVNRLILPQNHKNNIISIIKVEPEDCTFTLRQREYEIRIDLKVKNRYVETEFLLEYDYTSSKMEYIIAYTHHDSLESMPWFKSEVKRIENEKGYRYEFCYRGHDFERSDEKFLIKNEFKTIVMFEKDGSEDHYGYRLDFNTGNLEHYHTYDFMEYCAFFG